MPPRQLEAGEVYIVYHPASGRAPEISTIPGYELEEYALKPQQEVPSNAPPHPDLPPWFPFTSLDDFRQVEIWVKHGCSSTKITEEIALHRDQARERGIQPFYDCSSPYDMHRMLANARAIANVSQVRTFVPTLSLPLTCARSVSNEDIRG